MRSGRPAARLHPEELAALDEEGRAFAETAAGVVEACWSHAWEQRPSMAEVVRRLGEAPRYG